MAATQMPQGNTTQHEIRDATLRQPARTGFNIAERHREKRKQK